MAKFHIGQRVHRINLPKKVGKIVAGPMKKFVYPIRFDPHRQMAHVGAKQYYTVDFGRTVCINCNARDFAPA